MVNRWMQAVLFGIASVLIAQSAGCSRLTTDMVVGVYDLESAVIRYGEGGTFDQISDEDSVYALGGSLQLNHLCRARIHLRPDGRFYIPIGEPAISGTWTIESNQLVGYLVELDPLNFEEGSTYRYEVDWHEGVLTIPLSGPEIPVDYVFVKRKEVLND